MRRSSRPRRPWTTFYAVAPTVNFLWVDAETFDYRRFRSDVKIIEGEGQ